MKAFNTLQFTQGDLEFYMSLNQSLKLLYLYDITLEVNDKILTEEDNSEEMEVVKVKLPENPDNLACVVLTKKHIFVYSPDLKTLDIVKNKVFEDGILYSSILNENYKFEDVSDAEIYKSFINKYKNIHVYKVLGLNNPLNLN